MTQYDQQSAYETDAQPNTPEDAAPEFAEDDLLDALDEDSSELKLKTLYPKGEYVVKFGRAKPVAVQGADRPLILGYDIIETAILYDIAGGKHMNVPIRGYVRERDKETGEMRDNGIEQRTKLMSAIYVAAAYGETGWQGERKELYAMHAEIVTKMNAKEPGYSMRDILNNARDFYAICPVSLSEAKGQFDASNMLEVTRIRPISPTLLRIMMDKHGG